MAFRIQIRRDTTVGWAAVNPILAQGELGIDLTQAKFKIGDGTSTWSLLVFATGPVGPTGATGAASTVPGPTGPPGSLWRSGTGAPAGALGVVTDWYLNDTNGDIYEKTAAAVWTLRDNLLGPIGATGSQGTQGIQGIQGVIGPAGAAGSVWRSGTGVPAGALGIVGDWYLNDANGDIYEKTGAATWTLRDNLLGPAGPQGTQGIQGIQGPAGSGSGDVVGPVSSTNDLPVVFDGITGKLIKEKTYAAFKTLLVLIKGDVGLGSVDNTTDAGKPVSTAQQTALDLKVTAPALAVTDDMPAIFDGITGKLIKQKTYAAFKTLLVLVKGDVGLGSVDNTTDAGKPVSTAQQTALDAKQPLDADLTALAGLLATTDNFIQSKASAWASRTIAQVKTDLGLTGTNSGDQSTIAGFSSTKAQFDTAASDGNFSWVGNTLAADHTGGNWQVFYTSGTGVITELALGASGTVLKSNGAAAAPSFGAAGGITLLATQATTSGTAFDFTIPAGAKRVTVMFNGVSLSGNDEVLIQLGDAGGIEATGYVSGYARIRNGAAIATLSSTTAFTISNTAIADAIHGTVVLTLQEASTFTWVSFGTVIISGSLPDIYTSSGRKALTQELTTVRVTRSNTATFDLGSVSVSYDM